MLLLSLRSSYCFLGIRPLALARRSNTIKTIAAEPIHENDIFECEFASGRHIHHKPDIFKERGEVVGYYCLVELSNGGEQFKVMSKKDVEKHRDKFSKAFDPKDTNNIWNKNFDAMAVMKEEREDIKDFTDDVEYTVSDAPAEATETPVIEDKTNWAEAPKKMAEKVNVGKPETKEPIQPSFDEMNGMTDEEMAAADAAFDSVPENPNDIF